MINTFQKQPEIVQSDPRRALGEVDPKKLRVDPKNFGWIKKQLGLIQKDLGWIQKNLGWINKNTGNLGPLFFHCEFDQTNARFVSPQKCQLGDPKIPKMKH